MPRLSPSLFLLLLACSGAETSSPPSTPEPPPAPIPSGGWFGPLALEQSQIQSQSHVTLQGVLGPASTCAGKSRVELRQSPGDVSSGLVTAVTPGADGSFTLLAPVQVALVLTAACDQNSDGSWQVDSDLRANKIPLTGTDQLGLTLSLEEKEQDPVVAPPPGSSGLLEAPVKLGDPRFMKRRPPGNTGLRQPSLGAPKGG